MEFAEDELFEPMTLDEFCKRSSMPRSKIERYLVATEREDLLHGGSTMLIRWEWLQADLPAFSAYLDHNHVGRPEPEIAARADDITVAIWRYANPRMCTGGRVTQRLRRIRSRLETLQRKTSPNQAGELVAAALKNFPYLEAKPELDAARETIRPHRPPTVAEEIAVIDLMIAALAKRGPRSRNFGGELVGKLAADHEWLTGRSRQEYASRFREFVKSVIECPRGFDIPDDLRTHLTATTLIR